jgi:hypothetical protein
MACSTHSWVGVGAFATVIASCFGGGGGVAGPGPDLLAEAKFFDGRLPGPTAVTYTSESGEQVTVQAYPGMLVVLAASSATIDDIEAIAGGVMGDTVMALPAHSIYWLRVQSGDEGSAIDSLRASSVVDDAFPLVPIHGLLIDPIDTCGGVPMAPAGAGAIVIDTWGAGSDDHGVAVAGEAEACGTISTNYNVRCDGQNSMDRLHGALARALEAAHSAGHVVPINLSLGANTAFNDCVERSGCQDADCRGSKEAALGFWKTLFKQLHETLRKDSRALDRVVITIAASNEGLEITEELRTLREEHPEVWQRVVFVSTIGNGGMRCNSSLNEDDIVYVDATSTSLATPLATCLIAEVAQRRPDLTGAQIKEAILDAAPLVGVRRALPTAEQVLEVAPMPEPITTATPMMSPSGPVGPPPGGDVCGAGATIDCAAACNQALTTLTQQCEAMGGSVASADVAGCISDCECIFRECADLAVCMFDPTCPQCSNPASCSAIASCANAQLYCEVLQ